VIGRTLSHYKILDEINRGGMGIVYRAVDLKLNREVALKILPPELVSDPVRKRRFVQEAQVAAALDHPHVATVYEIDEADGVTFIAMELIRGEKLQDLMTKEKLPLSRALDLAIETAEGLEAAHDKGILHRDLKPANIMVTQSGRAKVIDFGLAKLIEPLEGLDSGVETPTAGMTETSAIVGTYQYMSPEQVRKQTVDERSDVFSFGIVFYEMLTGDLPFAGPSPIEMLNAILKEHHAPVLISENSQAEHDSNRIINKCLAKDPAERYRNMKEVVTELRALRLCLATSGQVTRPRPAPRRRKLYYAAAVAVLMAGILAWVLWPKPPETPSPMGRPAIAVLFFDNMSQDPTLDWLRYGLTDMLVTDLSQTPRSGIISTDRLYRILKELALDDESVTSAEVVEQIAERANAETVILGSFMQAGNNLRINLRIEQPDGDILASESVEGAGEEAVFTMVGELTRRVRDRLEIGDRAESGSAQRLEDVTTSSFQAYRHYAEGTRILNRGEYELAIPLLEQATKIDPEFAMAFAQLGLAHGNLGHDETYNQYIGQAYKMSSRLPEREKYYIEGLYFRMSTTTLGRALESLEKVVELYPDHDEARFRLGAMYMVIEDYRQAIAHLEEVRRRKYTFPNAYDCLASSYVGLGEFEKAESTLREYLNQNPESSRTRAALGIFLMTRGRIDEAMSIFENEAHLRQHSPSPMMILQILVHILREDWKQAESTVQRMSERGFTKDYELYFRARIQLYYGRAEDALDLFEQTISTDPTNLVRMDMAHVMLENKMAAAAIEQARIVRNDDKGARFFFEHCFFEALAQSRLGNFAEAETIAEEVREWAELVPGYNRPERIWEHLLGEIALARGDFSQAIRHLEQAETRLSLGDLFGNIVDHAEQVPIWFSLASAHLASGNELRAAEWFQKIAESGYEHLDWPIPYVRSFYFLGKIHENRGEVDQARHYYQRFVDFWKDGDMDRDRVEEALQKLRTMS
jgi:tetratricopeptide (TPR) repeat protein/predicted Ser/Thr protein kinase